MNIRPLESLTKEELIGLVKQERDGTQNLRNNFLDEINRKNSTIQDLIDRSNLPYLLKSGEVYFWDREGNNNIETLCSGAAVLIYANDLMQLIARSNEREGWKLVPVEPTEAMNIAARDWSTGKYGKAIGTDASEGCYKSMLAAAPQPDHIPDAGKMVVSDRSMKEIKAALAGAKGKEHTLIFSAKEVRGLLNTIVNQNQRIERFEKKIAEHIAQDRKMQTDTDMLDWLIENEALICHSVTDNSYEIWFGIDNIETGKTAREAITKAMRGEE